MSGSISVSGQLPTYPSPNSTTVTWQQVKANVGLGEGKVGSCPDTDIDPDFEWTDNLSEYKEANVKGKLFSVTLLTKFPSRKLEQNECSCPSYPKILVLLNTSMK